MLNNCALLVMVRSCAKEVLKVGSISLIIQPVPSLMQFVTRLPN